MIDETSPSTGSGQAAPTTNGLRIENIDKDRLWRKNRGISLLFLGKDIKNAKKTYTEEGNSNQKSAIRSEIREERRVLHMTSKTLRSHWQNCYGPDDNSFLSDDDLKAIDEMEDSIVPLKKQTVQIRQVITRFEACYHKADKESEYIIKSIAAGYCLEQSNKRPPKRKKELENTLNILSSWCKNTSIMSIKLDVGGISASELLSFIGEPTPLKTWQVERIVDRVQHSLDNNSPYYNLALNLGDYGEAVANQAEKHYQNNPPFLKQTRETIIHDTVDGKASKVSLAFAIDLLMPCCWDFVGCLVTILKAIGGDLHPEKPLACCTRNIKLSPLCSRLETISNTLKAFWKDETSAENIDRKLLKSLGTPTPVTRWLAASLDKTIRLHLSLPFNLNLF